jgi:hypothetical protein
VYKTAVGAEESLVVNLIIYVESSARKSRTMPRPNAVLTFFPTSNAGETGDGAGDDKEDDDGTDDDSTTAVAVAVTVSSAVTIS